MLKLKHCSKHPKCLQHFPLQLHKQFPPTQHSTKFLDHLRSPADTELDLFRKQNSQPLYSIIQTLSDLNTFRILWIIYHRTPANPSRHYWSTYCTQHLLITNTAWINTTHYSFTTHSHFRLTQSSTFLSFQSHPSIHKLNLQTIPHSAIKTRLHAPNTLSITSSHTASITNSNAKDIRVPNILNVFPSDSFHSPVSFWTICQSPVIRSLLKSSRHSHNFFF